MDTKLSDNYKVIKLTKKIQKSAETNKEALQAGQEILENRRRFGGGGRDV